MSDYKKPINKETYTVRFIIGKHDQNMEIRSVPKIGECVLDLNRKAHKIKSVSWVPWNKEMEDILVETEPC